MATGFVQICGAGITNIRLASVWFLKLKVFNGIEQKLVLAGDGAE
jgi:hypothetical protein